MRSEESRRKRADYCRMRRDKARAQHLCLTCLQPLNAAKQAYCATCRERMRQDVKELKIRRRQTGLCLLCGKPASVRVKQPLCQDCWFKEISRNRTGTSHNWQLIKGLFESQKQRCAYTGIMLIPGQNASLDHIVPTHQGGDNSIYNLQWVDYQINIMKNSLNHDEFIGIIKMILERLPPDSLGESADETYLKPDSSE